MISVVNKHFEHFTVYIGRGSIWGNPFSHLIGTKAQFKVETREEAIECYRSWLWTEIREGRITKELLLTLDNQILGCYCSPKRCHGEILRAAVEWAKKQ